MKTWFPLAIENCLIDGRPATQQIVTWRRLEWRAATRASTPLGTALKVPPRKSDAMDAPLAAIHHTINVHHLALALEPGEFAVPIAMPSVNETPAPPTGWLWLIGNAEGGRRNTEVQEVPPRAPRPVVSHFADLIGG